MGVFPTYKSQILFFPFIFYKSNLFFVSDSSIKILFDIKNLIFEENYLYLNFYL